MGAVLIISCPESYQGNAVCNRRRTFRGAFADCRRHYSVFSSLWSRRSLTLFIPRVSFITFLVLISTLTPVYSAIANLPFQWPVGSSRDVTNDYAHYNRKIKNVPPNRYHTALDIFAPEGTLIRAAAAGKVVVRCLPPNHPGSPDADCPANDKPPSTELDNHGLQGVVILQHTLADGKTFYSLYGHLGNINLTPAVGQDVSPGQALGTTNDLDHVHFEIKARPVLHNPYCPGCTVPTPPPVCNEQPPCYWGYTPRNPNDSGYYDPVLFLHNISDPLVGTSVQVTQDNVNARMGPEASVNGYPILTHVNAGQSFAAIRKRSEPTTGCSNGWYQIGSGRRFVATDFGNDPASEIPDVWICADFVSQGSRILGDINGDGIVNSLDWSIMNSKWLTNDANADLNRDGIVNSIDWSIMNSNWLKTAP